MKLYIEFNIQGAVILTRYNNRTYRIDDIAFDKTPKTTFDADGKEIMIKDYFKKQYDIDIRDLDQPLLIHRKEIMIAGQLEKKELTFCLVPEICYLTGMTDAMRGDYTVMKDLASHTRLSPMQRVNSFKKFINNVNNTPEARMVLDQWGLRFGALFSKF